MVWEVCPGIAAVRCEGSAERFADLDDSGPDGVRGGVRADAPEVVGVAQDEGLSAGDSCG